MSKKNEIVLYAKGYIDGAEIDLGKVCSLSPSFLDVLKAFIQNERETDASKVLERVMEVQKKQLKDSKLGNAFIPTGTPVKVVSGPKKGLVGIVSSSTGSTNDGVTYLIEYVGYNTTVSSEDVKVIEQAEYLEILNQRYFTTGSLVMINDNAIVKKVTEGHRYGVVMNVTPFNTMYLVKFPNVVEWKKVTWNYLDFICKPESEVTLKGGLDSTVTVVDKETCVARAVYLNDSTLDNLKVVGITIYKDQITGKERIESILSNEKVVLTADESTILLKSWSRAD